MITLAETASYAGRPTNTILGCDETVDVKEIDLHWRKSSNPSLFDDCGKKKEEARRSQLEQSLDYCPSLHSSFSAF